MYVCLEEQGHCDSQTGKAVHVCTTHTKAMYLLWTLIFVIVQGPVVQSIVSLTSSLRGQLIKCFTTL